MAQLSGFKMRNMLQKLHISHISRRYGRRMHESNPPNWHFCMADGPADATSAAAGSRVSAADICAICVWRV